MSAAVLSIAIAAVLFAAFAWVRPRSDCGGSCGACAGGCALHEEERGGDTRHETESTWT